MAIGVREGARRHRCPQANVSLDARVIVWVCIYIYTTCVNSVRLGLRGYKIKTSYHREGVDTHEGLTTVNGRAPVLNHGDATMLHSKATSLNLVATRSRRRFH